MAYVTRAVVFLLFLLLCSLLFTLTVGEDPAEKFCSEQCQGLRESKECERQCLDLYRQREKREKDEAEESEEEQGQRGTNPYYFGEESFKHWRRTPHGHFKVLQRFSKKSKLLVGIDNYRLAIIEAEPETFVLPSHWDAEELLYVTEGSGAITMLWEEKRESHDLRKGDIMRVPAGAIVYLINKDDKQKLSIALILQPVSIPGRFKEFFGAGGRDPETFYTSFSNEVLEAAFNTSREKLERLFGRQRKGVIIKATKEQLKAISKHSSSTRVWPFSKSSWKPRNLLDKGPSHENEHGKLHEVDSNDYERLRDIDVDVSMAIITSGSMMVPNFNSKATKVALGVNGTGYIVIVSPHVSQRREGEQEQEQEQERGREEGHERGREEYGLEEQEKGRYYKGIRMEISSGSVVAIPAGHPTVVVNTGEGDLEVLCFGLLAENNKKNFLAGKKNILKQMDKVAMSLAFDNPAELVEDVLNAQKDSVFVQGPQQRGQSVQGFAGF